MNNIVISKKYENKEETLLGKIKKKTDKNYLAISKYNLITVGVIILAGVICFFVWNLNLGVDFKGGSAINVKAEEKIDLNIIDSKLAEYTVVEKSNVSNTESYYKIKEVLSEKEINTLRDSLSENNYKVNISVISNIVKRDLTKNAVKALIIASIVVLLYIAIRFASTYGISSIIAIISDVLVTISIFIIFKVEINFIFIAGILTIIGYSINDTIIVFDMIRDKMKLVKTVNEKSLIDTVNNSIKLSLKRNILTSVTTLSAIVVLLFMNISAINEFNYTVFIGLLAGTFSSLFIAPYIWLKLETRNLHHPKEKNDEDDEIEEKLIKGINA